VTEQLEAQMRAERARRENELNVRASINTAEGSKRAKILESEGLLQVAMMIVMMMMMMVRRLWWWWGR
jgi:regulator of protease activity HflC (stomatin/prohibitin superfamily)